MTTSCSPRGHGRVRLLACASGVVALLGCNAAVDDASPGITSPPVSFELRPSATDVSASTDPGSTGPVSSSAGSTNPVPTPSTVAVSSTSCASYETNLDLPLQLCDKGDLVQSVQAQVARVLGASLEADGFFGPGTEKAVAQFQSQSGLDPDGVVGPNTWNELFGSVLPVTGPTRGIAVNWFAQPAKEAVAELEAQEFIVIAYEVCSGSVDAGEVRQIIGGDGTVYLDKAGITADGEQLPIGEVIEVKVGSGSPC